MFNISINTILNNSTKLLARSLMSAISLISVRSHLLLIEIEITKSGNFAIICYFKLYANNWNFSISSILPQCGNGMQVVPKELRYVTILTLLGGSSPAIAIWLNKVIIDEITRLLSIGTRQNAIALILSQPLLLSSIAGSLLVNLVDYLEWARFA